MGEIRAAAGGLTRAIIWIVVVLLLCAGGSLLALKWDVWFSGKSGAANVQIQNNNSDNRIQAQHEFDDLWGQIQGFKQDIKADPQDASAAEQECVLAVTKYNDLANGFTSKDWRPPQDPVNVPFTECNP